MQDPLSELKNNLVGEWNNYLKSFFVKYPTSENRLMQLLCLYEFYPNPVSQNEMDEWIRDHGGKNDRQARHLAWDGWYIQTGNAKSTRMKISTELKSDQLQLVSLIECNPIWKEYHERQAEYVAIHPEYPRMIIEFSGRGCAICGVKTIFLEPYSNVEENSFGYTIIPICEGCNKWCVIHSFTLLLFEGLIARPKLSKSIR